jgi:hypothetical protein
VAGRRRHQSRDHPGGVGELQLQRSEGSRRRKRSARHALHCLAVDHTKLTFKFQGRNYRLTDVHGRVVRELPA